MKFHRFCDQNEPQLTGMSSDPSQSATWVSGLHDVDFTHENQIVHYFHCMRIEGYLLWYSRRCQCQLGMDHCIFSGGVGVGNFLLREFVLVTKSFL